ncbi:LysR family transcriptional regulator [Agrobacterium vitis]|uniref:LysR family transcriptional regulator n=1 Tax=Agrobacterium vitis TaxID=373 RepID=A0A368NXC5_AGRVI|nr:LysR family transcriptional regulator [Agrobacterium vitis]KAA3519709.1 LysR family transcriptional regulator [Agrobacterium vitis]KAA3532078.1 LysR family transcriptional regulator [Agrobacterium vitis]MCF1475864.1 LysR family transcriptional regulator [Agrobacterium vitis]MUZ97078.1 LysR family transcriptional regulator [Agrobacterium vitis]MVA32032.1 LysR family transcriptional regulator [Agrobacterium vitis]
MDTVNYTHHLSTFVDVVRAGSFSAVARRQGMKPSSIARKIDMLEDYFGAALFVRSTRALMLTDVGEVLVARAEVILNELNAMRVEIKSIKDNLDGPLRISCLPTFGKLHILPWLPKLRENFPRMTVELDLTERIANPSIERLDAVLRIGPLNDSGLYAKTIGVQRWLVCASPAYLDRYGKPASWNELAGHAIVDKLHDPAGICWRGALDPQGYSAMSNGFRCNDFDGLRQAALGGLGLAYLPDWVALPDITAGRLVKLFDDSKRGDEPIHLLRASSKPSARLQIFHDALLDHLRSFSEAGRCTK